jgi:hypothetical protein
MFLDEDIWKAAQHYRLVILGVKRLLEMAPERTAWLKACIQKNTEHLLVYVYDSVKSPDESLCALAMRVGLRLTVRGSDPRVAVAELISVAELI